MRPLMYFLLGVTIAVVLTIPTASAATLVKQPDGTLRVLQRNLDGTATYTNVREANGNLIVERNLGTKTIGAAQGARVPVTIDVVAKKTITKDLLAKAAVKNLRLGLLGGVGVVVDVIDALDLHYDPTCNCIVQGNSPSVETIDSVKTASVTLWNPDVCTGTPYTATASTVSALHSQYIQLWSVPCTDGVVRQVTSDLSVFEETTGGYFKVNYTVQNSNYVSSNLPVSVTHSCPAGYSLSLDELSCTRSSEETQLSDSAASDLIKLSDPHWPDFMEDLAGDGDGIDTSEVPDPSPEIAATPDSSTTITPTGPGTTDLKSPKSIKDNGDGTRTEDGTTVHTTVEGDTITYNISNTSKVINNVTNQTVSTSNESNDGADLQTGVVTDTALPTGTLLFEMPEVPDFYEQKYPDGFRGEWDNFTDQMDQTPFFQLIDQLTPDWSGGECPSWSISFDLGFANYGHQVVEPPCWIFPYLKIIILVTALFVARGLVFGG